MKRHMGKMPMLRHMMITDLLDWADALRAIRPYSCIGSLALTEAIGTFSTRRNKP